MVWYNPTTWFKPVNEEIKSFENKGEKSLTPKQMKAQNGEAVDDFSNISGYGITGYGSFDSFYDNLINVHFKNKNERIAAYRKMSSNPEINDVLDDIIVESTQEDTDGEIIKLNIVDETFQKNENIKKQLNDEFDELFKNRLKISEIMDTLLNNYFIDGILSLENVINVNKPKDGIINIKTLPPETMDYLTDMFGNITHYIQYLKPGVKKPKNVEDAQKDKNIIVLNKNQVSWLQFSNKYGYLELCKVPYNQLKLLETSLIIYRIVRAPERFVFKIDTGTMPKSKAMKFVEMVKTKMNRRQTFDPETGVLSNSTDVFSIMDNIYLPQGDGKGSDVDSIGGNSSGFTELDDIFYFQKKLYRSLKYPLSRIENKLENRSSETLFRGSSTEEIVRDEVKWAKFLEKHQKKMTKMLKDIFILHLRFKDIWNRHGLKYDSFEIEMNPPSDYKEQMNQMLLETRFNNYSQLSGEDSFSKVFLQKKYLKWDDETIKENIDSLKKDKEFGLTAEEDEF